MPRVGSQSQVPMEEESGGVDKGLDGVAGVRFLSGTCPDPKCQARLYCMSSYQSIECTGCGQVHTQSALQNLKEEKGDIYNTALLAIKSLIAGVKPEPGPDNVKVHGLSNYLCKLLSHLLSRYGMDKSSGRAKLLTEMGQPEIFDCGVLCDRAFHIDPEHLNIIGYGRDRSGGVQYLSDTLNVARDANDHEERLIPIHADGDGHCLVHAISRALVGRELFWHPLRLNLMQHFQSNLERYKELFQNFVDVDEWEDIINECQPNFVPKDGETVGLRNIHIFGLANVLKRPIILLDSPHGISSSADYSGVFLPAMLKPEQCKNKEGVLNSPLCIAWSNQGRNHFIPLVGIKEKPCPRLPRYMLQGAWGVHPSQLDQYMAFDDQGCCIVGGSRSLHENYIHRLVAAMEEVFYSTYKVHPALVADVHQYIFRSKGFVGVTLDMVIDKTFQLVKNQALVRCLRCSSLTALEVTEKMLTKGGRLYELALKEIGELNSSKMYTFTDYQMCCRYNAEKDCLEPDLSKMTCPFCQSELKFRYMNGDGSIQYNEGDVTLEPAGPNSRCKCGFKHYYYGKFYDNRPREIAVPLEWNGKTHLEFVNWWENESDPQLNSNVYQIAQDLVLKYFPGEFGIERLQQKIVAVILRMTASKDKKEVETCDSGAADGPAWNAEEASKIILSGFQRQGIHKEELTKSETERQVKKKIEAHAPQQQTKKTAEPSTSSASTSKRSSPSRTSLTKTRASSLKASSSAPSTPSHQAGMSPPQSVTPPSTPKVASKEKKIRVVVTGGLSATVTLTEDMTYSQLQQVVLDAVHIPAEHQKLRLGFPPKVLPPPQAGEEEKTVPINHGDKISVENTAVEAQAPAQESTSSSSWSSSPRSSMKGHVDAHMPSEDAFINALAARVPGGDSLDNSLISLGILAETMGMDMWNLVQSQPHHFSRGGLYYRQAERDVGLVDDKHFKFPAFPGKTFVYNGDLDRLELCLDDLGHFEVEADVEKKAERQERKGRQHSHHLSARPASGVAKVRKEDPGRTSFGSSGAITKNITSQHVFEGHGHSLRDPAADDKMPQDVPLTESIHGAARRLQDFCDPEHNRPSIVEEPEKMDTETRGSGAEGQEDGYRLPKYTRKGPGFSVLEPPPPSSQETEAEQQLLDTVQRVVDFIGQGDSGEAEEEVKGEEKEKEGTEGQCAAEDIADETEHVTSEEVADDAMETS